MSAVQFQEPNGDSSDEPEESRLTLSEHLEELRVRLFRIVIALVIGLILGWVLQPYVYQELEHIVLSNAPKSAALMFPDITGPFMLKLKLSFYIGLVITLPFSVLQLWGFIAPGLKPSERKPLRVVAPLSVLLFMIGASICWFVLPIAVRYFSSFADYFDDARLFLHIDTTIFFLVKMILAFGIGFELPLVVYFLTRVGIITPRTMLKYWRQSLFGIFVASAIITPTGDIFTLAVMAVPLSALFFLSVWAALVSRRRSGLDELEDLD